MKTSSYQHIYNTTNKNACSNCPNKFECPLKGRSDFYKNEVCLIKRLPLFFSDIVDGLSVPEEPEIFTERLEQFIESHKQ